MADVTFEFDIGDIVMIKPMKGSEVTFDMDIKDHRGNLKVDQYRITQRRYVEEYSGAGKISYSALLVGTVDKNVNFGESVMIRVDDFLAKKAIVDSNKPKKEPSLGAQIFGGGSLTSTLLPGAQTYFDNQIKEATIRQKMLEAQAEALKNSL